MISSFLFGCGASYYLISNKPVYNDAETDTQSLSESLPADAIVNEVVESEVQIDEPNTRTEVSEEMPPFPLKDKNSYPLNDELKNIDEIKFKGDKEDELYEIMKSLFYVNIKGAKFKLIDLAYSDLKGTSNVEFMDYDKQDWLFKNYLERHYAEFMEELD